MRKWLYLVAIALALLVLAAAGWVVQAIRRAGPPHRPFDDWNRERREFT